MNSSIIRYILGNVMRMEACFLLLPCIVSLVYGEGVGLYYLGTAIVCLAFGVVMAWKKPKNYVFYLKEGCIATSLSWIVMSLVAVSYTHLDVYKRQEANSALRVQKQKAAFSL